MQAELERTSDETAVEQPNARFRAGLGVAAVVAVLAGAYALSPLSQRWEQRFMVSSVEVDDTGTELTIHYDGCDETFRHSVVEGPDQIVVVLENQVQDIYHFCSRGFSHELVLDAPVGDRRILEGRTNAAIRRECEQ